MTPSYAAKEPVRSIFAMRKYILRVLMINVHFSSSPHTSSDTNLLLPTPSLARCLFKPNSITEIDREALPFSRRFLLGCGNRESLWTGAALGQQGDNTD